MSRSALIEIKNAYYGGGPEQVIVDPSAHRGRGLVGRLSNRARTRTTIIDHGGACAYDAEVTVLDGLLRAQASKSCIRTADGVG